MDKGCKMQGGKRFATNIALNDCNAIDMTSNVFTYQSRVKRQRGGPNRPGTCCSDIFPRDP